MKEAIVNVFAAIGLIFALGACLSPLWLDLRPECDISIKNKNGTSCYVIKEYRK